MIIMETILYHKKLLEKINLNRKVYLYKRASKQSIYAFDKQV